MESKYTHHSVEEPSFTVPFFKSGEIGKPFTLQLVPECAGSRAIAVTTVNRASALGAWSLGIKRDIKEIIRIK